jgi:tetratricopeptide (TPR) repeat protein
MAAASDTIISSTETLTKARDAESAGKLEDAAALYEQLVKENISDEFVFDRLMILYRKLKLYKDELRIINKGIKVFEDIYKRSTGRKSAKQEKLTTLSNAFMKTAGLKDKKGNLLYIPEPLSRWMKRKTVVEKKLIKKA